MAKVIGQHPWIPYVLPLLVYMCFGLIEPSPPPDPAVDYAERQRQSTSVAAAEPLKAGFSIDYRYYPLFYSIRVLATIATMLLVSVVYRQFPLRISPLALVVGAVGIVVWVGFCRLDLEEKIFVPLGLGEFLGSGQRVSFNPYEQLGHRPFWMVMFIAVRFLGLAAVVSIIEEFFLRGFLLRFVLDPVWWNVRFGTANRLVIILPTIYGVLAHPAEAFAAAAWFSLITWLMLRTRNIWDCVAAHAVTNLLLGIYVLIWQDWALW